MKDVIELAKQQWESWKKYALELQERLVKYEGGAPMVLNASHPQATEPAVYKLVPVNATPEMIEAAEQVEDLYRRGTPDTWGSVYRAMLAAAPEAKQ